MEIPCMPHEQHAQRFLHDTHALHGRNIFLLAGAVDFFMAAVQNRWILHQNRSY